MHASGLWSFCMYIPLTSKKYKFQPQTNSFPENNSPFSIKPTVLWVKISEKKNISFSGLRSCYNMLANRKKLVLLLEKYFRILKDMISGTELCTIFQSGQNNGVKLWEFDEYSRAFPYKVTPNIEFTDEVVVQCDDVKVVLVIYKWSQINFGVNTYGWLMCCFCTHFCI